MFNVEPHLEIQYMSTNKQIFLNWLESKKIPSSELDHNLAKDSELKFDNHEDNAGIKNFLSKDSLETSFKTVIKVSY